MQTAIHDLSHYAVVENNNDNANLLAGYMMEAGFGPLSTEWWHFQDDDTRGTLSLTIYQVLLPQRRQPHPEPGGGTGWRDLGL